MNFARAGYLRMELYGRQMCAMITHKYRGSQQFSISKSVEPNEELKVEQIFPQVLSTIDTTLRTLTFALPRTSMKLEVLCRCDRIGLQANKENVNKK